MTVIPTLRAAAFTTDNEDGCRPSNQDLVILAGFAESVLRFRRRTEQILAQHDVVAEQAWGIMLEVFRSNVRAINVTVSDAATSADLASATATRWIGILEAQGLLRRRTDPDDKRRVLLVLTAKGLALMTQALATLHDKDNGCMPPGPGMPAAFFAGAIEGAASRATLHKLRHLADVVPPADMPALLLKCAADLARERARRKEYSVAADFEAQMERMIGIGAYESAVLHLARQFAHSWTPALNDHPLSGQSGTSAGLATALLRNMLDYLVGGATLPPNEHETGLIS